MNYIKYISIGLFAFCLGVASLQIAINLNESNDKNIGIVDVNKIIKNHMNIYLGKNLSEKEISSLSSSFAKSLNSSIEDVSNSQKVTLMVSGSVVSTVPDYTNYIEALIIEKLKNEK